MIVAHGTWLAASARPGLFLWAESWPASPAREEDGDEPPPHPFHLPRRRLARAVLRPLGEPDGATRPLAGEATFRFPVEGGRPLASPELRRLAPGLGAGDVAGDAAEATRPFRVRGLLLPPVVALGWLARLPEEAERGLAVGADLRFWAAASRFGLELLARQRFVPDLELSGRRRAGRARWRAWLDDEHDRLDALAASMPGACLAISGDAAAPAPRALLESFYDAVVDAFVRAAAARLRLRPRFLDTPGARFAAALLDARGRLAEPRDVLVAMREQLDEWRAGLEEEPNVPFRLAFRLEPPAEDADVDGWTLRYLLQAVDDPSLLVPLGRIWRHSGSSWRYGDRRLDRPHERVLEGLARAASLCPAIEESLGTARPEAARLGLDEAYRFLTETAFLLEESGFGVLVPSWWQRRQETGIGLRLRVEPAESRGKIRTGLGLDALVAFDWDVALGEQTLSREEFLELAELKRPLVRVRGRWVELDRDRIEQALAVLRARPAEATMRLGDVLRLRFGRPAARGLPVTGLGAEGWIAELLDRLAGTEPIPELGPPRSFRGVLRPYQLVGLRWLAFLARWGFGACLADDMGLGKTIQVLALLLHLQERGELDSPYLLICPTSVVSNWRKEAERFAPSLEVLVHHGLDRHGGERFVEEARRRHLVVSTYSLVHRDLDVLASVRWGGIVVDEAQNIKNPQAKQTRALNRLRAPVRIALTGTPVENRLSELWSIMQFLNPGYLGSPLEFKRRFAVPIERFRDAAAAEELHRLVRPFVLRRVKTDPTVIRDLPEKNEMKVYCSLTREQATLYQAVVRESLERIADASGIGRKGEVLAALTRLKQICNHPVQFLGDGGPLDGRSGKLSRLGEMLEEVLAEGDRALVFTQYAEMGTLLRRHLRERLAVEVLFLHGGVPARDREAMIARFQDDPDGPPVFVLSLRAGGFGLNLTRARHVFHFDRWWNPAVEDQATDRAFRIGQTRSVAVHKLICAGTVEEKIDELIEQKKEIASLVVRAGEGWVTELSTDELRELFELRADAVQD